MIQNAVLQPRGPWTAKQRAKYRLDFANAVRFFRQQGYNWEALVEIFQDTIRDPESPWIGDDVC